MQWPHYYSMAFYIQINTTESQTSNFIVAFPSPSTVHLCTSKCPPMKQRIESHGSGLQIFSPQIFSLQFNQTRLSAQATSQFPSLRFSNFPKTVQRNVDMAHQAQHSGCDAKTLWCRPWELPSPYR
mmetsp:Transcript_15425/g.37994  ORF Transcript_15425/g.37994 Transcript_15425/m.37994 type:complete len:126 (-) Transcript_15425:1066-1443(-)